MKNSRTSFDSSLSFRAQRNAEPESRGNVSNLVLKLVGDLDPGSSPGRQKKNFFGGPYAVLIINRFIKHYYFVIKKILKHPFQKFMVMLEFSEHMYSATLSLIFLTLT